MSDTPGGRLIKRYANRKLYDTAASRYVTLEELALMLQEGEDLRIIDNQTKADITDSAARAIIEAERAKQDAKTARLREARLAMEAEAAAAEPTAQPKPRKRSTVGKR